jgi:hypothetical protein
MSYSIERQQVRFVGTAMPNIKCGETILFARRPNQSLKLTEMAVDDFAARQFAENDMISSYVRATDYMELALRRRSLAPVR